MLKKKLTFMFGGGLAIKGSKTKRLLYAPTTTKLFLSFAELIETSASTSDSSVSPCNRVCNLRTQQCLAIANASDGCEAAPRNKMHY